jgi:topoisomerase-4 subunit A
MNHLEPLMQQNFLEYASYVIVDRAIPDVRDGCKPVQRRILHTLFANEDGKFHKVANIIGEAMKLHPHGDASIGDALVVLANKEYFIEKQGNFGNVITGHAAAAARYIECRLTPLARQTLFNEALTEFQNSYDGRRKEPTFLPVKLPVVLLLGTEGIAVGMATKILPHNFNELLEAQIAILRQEKFVLYPDFLHGGAIDVAEYDDGRGKVKVRALIEAVGDKKVVIREIPYSTTTESVIASIESAIQKGKVKISSINDFTTDKVEIELTLARGTYADEVIPQLFAYTDCEVSISSNIVVIKGRHPVEMSVSEVLLALTDRLRAQVRAEIEHELHKLEERRHWLTLEQVFIEHRVYKRIETAETAEKMVAAVRHGMQPHVELFVRPMDDGDIDRLLEIRIRRISAFDVAKNRQDIETILEAIAHNNAKLRNLTKTTIDYLKGILKTFGKSYPRRTKIETFEVIDRKKVARQHIKLSYDTQTGFFGTDVKGSEYQMAVSEYDLILAISEDGTFRVMTAQNKVLLGKVVYLELFDPERTDTFTLVYRDSKRYAYAKKFQITKYVRNRAYRLISDKGGKVDILTKVAKPGTLRLSFVPGPRQRIKEATHQLNDLEVGTVAAKGIKLAPKPVSRLRLG